MPASGKKRTQQQRTGKICEDAFRKSRSSGRSGAGFQGPQIKEMARKISAGGFRSCYRPRKQTVEPVNGRIKEARGFRRFSMRGMAKARGEWSLMATVRNLLKLAKARAT